MSIELKENLNHAQFWYREWERGNIAPDAAMSLIVDGFCALAARYERSEAVVSAARACAAKLRSHAADPDTIYDLDRKMIAAVDRLDALDAPQVPTAEAK
jgi:hypothetical protein